jgi:hypothetical protein
MNTVTKILNKILLNRINNTLKRYMPWASRFHSKDTKMVQHMWINKYNATHKQNQGQKEHTIISIDSEKSFYKIQCPFMTKALKKLGIKRIYLSIIKVIYDRPTVNNILNGQKLKLFPLKWGMRQECAFCPL